MDKVVPFEWKRMFIGNQDWLFYGEITFRVVIIYLFTVILLAFIGKRGRSDMSVLDYLTIIILGSATGDVLFYPDVPILYAMLIVTLVVLLTKGLAYLRVRIEELRDFLIEEPIKVIENGKFLHENLRKAGLSVHEVESKLRTKGVRNKVQVKDAYLELDGDISVFKK